jgi:SAM-dependent methyltransferase
MLLPAKDGSSGDPQASPVRCRSCQSPNLSTFLSLGDVPLSDGLLREDDLEAPEGRYPLDVALCTDCALVQILEEVPPDVLFCQDYPYYSSFSETLLAHSKANVDDLIARQGLGPDSLAIELASNDGYLLQYFAQAGIPVQGIDPAQGPAQAAVEKGIPTLNTFFGLELARELAADGRHADVILGNNVLAHVPDLNGFVEGIGTLLKPDGVAVIEVPYLRELIDHCEFDTIYHEHLCYFSVRALDTLFRRHGLFLNDLKHLSIHGGSLRLYVEKRDHVGEAVRTALDEEARRGLDTLDFYESFASRVNGVKDSLGSMLRGLKADGKSIAAYGAAAKGAILVNYVGIGRDLIDFVADKNVHKQGRYMPGVHIPIVDPARILADMPDYVLLLPWNFKDEILRQQDAYRQAGGKFIIPIPAPEIV